MGHLGGVLEGSLDGLANDPRATLLIVSDLTYYFRLASESKPAGRSGCTIIGTRAMLTRGRKPASNGCQKPHRHGLLSWRVAPVTALSLVCLAGWSAAAPSITSIQENGRLIYVNAEDPELLAA